MHEEILNEQQKILLPFLKHFRKSYYLAGGTAIALYLGHRRSIDFDLFTIGTVNKQNIEKEIHAKKLTIDAVMVMDSGEYTLSIKGVKFTFLHYPFNVEGKTWLKDFISLPSLLDLAAMKAYTLGRRMAWKDYVDLYFLLKNNLTLPKIARRAGALFKGGFNERLLREQLCYFDETDMSEKIDFLGETVSNQKIRHFLKNTAVS